jgi:hypothetical protein
VTPPRSFHIGDVLSVTTGRLVSPRLIDGVYDVLQFMHGTPIWTHQIPRACKDAIPFIHEQHPQLATVDASKVNAENWRGWLAEQAARFGEHVELTPIPHAEELKRDPMAELVEMVAPERVIVVDKGGAA